MKILFAGILDPTAREHGLIEAMQDLGHAVTPVATSSSLNPNGTPKKLGLLFRLSWKLGFQLDDTDVNKRLWACFESGNPDIVWIYKGNQIRASLLRRMKAASPRTTLVSYAEDDMYGWHNRTWQYGWALPYYDFVITTKSFNASPKELPRLGARRIIVIDNSFDRHRHMPMDLPIEERERFGSRVGFIGSFERDRAESTLFLAKNGIPVRVWGNEWESFQGRHPNLQVEGRPMQFELGGLGYAKGVCATDINLCFLRRLSRDLQTGRSIEIPACGGFMLAERTPDHRRLFKEDVEAVFFSSKEELLRKTRYYLDHPKERRRIAAAGRRRCLESDYSYHGRLKFLFNQISSGASSQRAISN